MNTLLQRKGPKLGLLLTEGFEDTMVIGKGARWADGLTARETRNLARMNKPEPVVSREMTVGIRGRIDSNGEIIRPLDEEDVREKLRFLVDKGARGFVVCLLWSYINPEHELRVEEIIKEEYPDCYLGSMPVVLSHKVLSKRFEYQRLNAASLNAYLHGSMSDELRGMSDELRSLGYNNPLMLIHNSGGMAEIFRTQALQTYNGGPVAGIIGSAYVGKLHGYDNVIISDMGGTSFDLGLVVAGSTRFYAFVPIIDRWKVDLTMLESISIGAGGGSIARINPVLGNRLEVGPQSAGSMPGPACYDQGGTEPTVTDADVALGYINPDNYHGGRMPLNKEKAIQVIKEKVAQPLGMGVEEAALLIKKVIDGNMGGVIFRETVLRGFDPKNFVLFAFGGAGATHCCGYGRAAGVPRIVTFPFSPVFCAFGAATMDILHFFEQSKKIILSRAVSGDLFSEYETFNSVVRDLQQRALKELALEGLPGESAVFSLELELKYGGVANTLRIVSPHLFVQSEDDIRDIYTEFEREYGEVYSPFATNPEGGVDVDNFILRVMIPRPKPELPIHEFKSKTPSQDSIKGKRSVYWEEYGDFHETPIYEQRLLECGNIIEGPAIIEEEDTTIVLPLGTRLTVNKYLSGEIELL